MKAATASAARGRVPEPGLEGRREGIVLEVAEDVLELGEVLPEALQGLLGADGLDVGDGAERPGSVARAPAGRRSPDVPGQEEETIMLGESSPARCWRLFERERKTPRMRNDRQMMVDREDVARPELPQVVGRDRTKYLSFWRIRGRPFR